MLKDQDRIFQNLYNDFGSDITSSQKRYYKLEAKAQIGAVSIFDVYGKGAVKYYTQRDQETILFAPTPTVNEKVYVLYWRKFL